MLGKPMWRRLFVCSNKHWTFLCLRHYGLLYSKPNTSYNNSDSTDYCRNNNSNQCNSNHNFESNFKHSYKLNFKYFTA